MQIENKHNSFAAKQRSKSACSPRKLSATASTVTPSAAAQQYRQRQVTIHQINFRPKQSSPKIDNRSSGASSVNNNNNSALSIAQQRKLFFQQNNFVENKPPSGRRSYAIVNTELHTNEM